jgi:arylsulfatase A-like enzyme
MNRRSFLKLSSAGALYERTAHGRPLQTRHLIFIVNGGGARKKDYYEDVTLAPNVRRIANDGFVFEQDHCESVASHDQAFAELFTGVDYDRTGALDAIPTIMENSRPRILVCREFAHDVGHDNLGRYLQAIQATDRRIGRLFDWVRSHPYFGNTTAIIIRPEFGRDDEPNRYGELHHSYGYYYTHRVASIFWGPDFRRGVDKTTVVSAHNIPPTLAALFNASTRQVQSGVLPGLFL